MDENNESRNLNSIESNQNDSLVSVKENKAKALFEEVLEGKSAHRYLTMKGSETL